jgi:hypothetical protein
MLVLTGQSVTNEASNKMTLRRPRNEKTPCSRNRRIGVRSGDAIRSYQPRERRTRP